MALAFFKTDVSSYTYNGTTVTAVTDGDYPNPTVPGVAYMNGRVYVMEADGTISHSDEDDPTSWDALNFVTAAFEPDAGIVLARLAEYIVAFGAYTVEFFYDAQNPTGAVITVVPNSTLMIGCLNARSLQQVEGGLIWVAQQRGLGGSVQLSRFVAILSGTKYERISTDDIDRILMQSDLTNIGSGVVTISGHEFYALTLRDAAICLVYDTKTGGWYQWTKTTAKASKTVTTLTQSNGLATAGLASHGLSDGDLVTISGATPSGYNLTANVNVVNASSFTYAVDPSTSSPGSGTIAMASWSESYFDVVGSCKLGDRQFVQEYADGVVSYIDLSNVTDQGTPIECLIRTLEYDGGSNRTKGQTDLALIGDQASTTALVRWSDDDYRTWNAYRRLALNTDRPHTTRGKNFRRRSYDIRYNLSTRICLTEIEIETKPQE